MLNTFNELLGENSESSENTAVENMAENNATVDISAIINRLNSLETAVDKLLHGETAKAKDDENPINGKDGENPINGKDEGEQVEGVIENDSKSN